MSTNQAALSSTIAVPEEAPTTKRLRTSSPEPENKRARLSDGSASPLSTVRTSPQVAPPARNTQANVPEPRPAQRKNSIQEEKKRGQRLFGSMLSTLSRSTPDGAQKRRQEIEKRQAEKAKQNAIDNKARENERLAKLRESRKTQQIKFDEATMQTRHSNILAMANFMSTKTEPSLYYKPWKFLPSDDGHIRDQISTAKVLIEREVDEFYTRHTHLTRPAVLATNEPETDVEIQEGIVSETVGEPKVESVSALDAHDDNDDVNDLTNIPVHEQAIVDTEADHSGEVVVEAEEDTVIY